MAVQGFSALAQEFLFPVNGLMWGVLLHLGSCLSVHLIPLQQQKAWYTCLDLLVVFNFSPALESCGCQLLRLAVFASAAANRPGLEREHEERFCIFSTTHLCLA